MEPVRAALISLWLTIDTHRRRALADDRGMTTEYAILIGLFSVAAVAIAGIIIVRATGWAERARPHRAGDSPPPPRWW